MICQRCLRFLRLGDGLKCDKCESRFHYKCVGESSRDLREGGDRLCQWKCAVCHKTTSKTDLDAQIPKETIIKVINCITEKFELVNKIQLPKLNSDLMQVKTVTEHIVKQNEDILRRITEMEKCKKCCGEKTNRAECTQVFRKEGKQSLRKRSVSLTPKKKANSCDECDRTPILPAMENNARCRARRSHLFSKMFNLLNRHVSKSKSRTSRRRL